MTRPLDHDFLPATAPILSSVSSLVVSDITCSQRLLACRPGARSRRPTRSGSSRAARPGRRRPGRACGSTSSYQPTRALSHRAARLGRLLGVEEALLPQAAAVDVQGQRKSWSLAICSNIGTTSGAWLSPTKSTFGPSPFDHRARLRVVRRARSCLADVVARCLFPVHGVGDRLTGFRDPRSAPGGAPLRSTSAGLRSDSSTQGTKVIATRALATTPAERRGSSVDAVDQLALPDRHLDHFVRQRGQAGADGQRHRPRPRSGSVSRTGRARG